jgi:hypothetical protein
MKNFTISTALALVLVMAMGASVSAGDQRPMKGGYTISVVPVEQRCGPNALTIGFEGVGIATPGSHGGHRLELHELQSGD